AVHRPRRRGPRGADASQEASLGAPEPRELRALRAARARPARQPALRRGRYFRRPLVFSRERGNIGRKGGAVRGVSLRFGSATTAASSSPASGRLPSATVSLTSPIAIARGALRLRPTRNSSLVRA